MGVALWWLGKTGGKGREDEGSDDEEREEGGVVRGEDGWW